MLARPLLSTFAAQAPAPWPAAWLTMAQLNGSPNELHAFTGPDGIVWTHVGAGPIIAATGYRDPSLLNHGGRWWASCTGGPSEHNFSILGSGDSESGWAAISTPDTTVSPSTTASWAPQWFVDVDHSVHILVSLQVSGARATYEMHPTNDAFTTWSTPTLVTGTGFATNAIDPNLTYWDGTYYLLWKNDDAGTICLSTSSSPFSGYTVAQTGDWAGWKGASGSIEGPQIVDIGTGWRIYFTNNNAFDGVAVYYSETTDRTMATGWSARTAIGVFSGYNHPLPIKRP